MCTLTFITTESAGNPPGLRVVMNRDELRTRPEALAPRWRELSGGTRAIWPTDPVGGGTWIAASSTGLVLCVLNLNLEPPPRLPEGLISRGQLIPRLVEAPTTAHLLESLRRTDLSLFAPFRLIVAPRPTEHEEGLWECRWDRQHLTTHRHPRFPVCFVSSGLGDKVVGPRLEMFKRLLAVLPTPAVQDRFHLHTWPGHEDVSVMMSRKEARTVSITTVEVGGPVEEPSIRMIYRPIADASVQKRSHGTPLAVIAHER
ncbi:MAG TPA: NRDE family protein [Phycisphaerales bacterium]|nr:NRDE family protein [Phycisphaerales bacterium]